MLKHPLRTTFALFILSFFCFSGLEACHPGTSPSTHDNAFNNEGLLTANSTQLKSTLITSHLEIPMQHNQNLLWCGTFQLAWNQLCTLAGGTLQFKDQAPESVTFLNRQSFTVADLDEASYYAAAGYIRDGILTRIPQELQHKFQHQAAPTLIPSGTNLRPQDIVAYSYLFKNLQFPTPYERGVTPSAFAGTPIACFGMGTDDKAGREPMANQTLIHDYLSPDNFVIELKLKNPEDRLILAKISPNQTLAQTVAAVQARITPIYTLAASSDILIIPKLNFDLTQSYNELLGHPLLPTTPDMAHDLQISSALQNIRFQMDEKGVRLKSEAHLVIGCAATSHHPTHQLIFDKPFLLLLTRTNSPHPYFALWIANPELLVHAK